METNVAAELVALFSNEETYLSCLPALNKIREKHGYHYITEALENTDIDSLIDILETNKIK
jgi:hypothetical protein